MPWPRCGPGGRAPPGTGDVRDGPAVPGRGVDAQRVLPFPGASLAKQVLGSSDLLWGGLVIFLVDPNGAMATVVSRRVSGPAAMLAGCLSRLAGTVVTLAGIETTSAAVFLAGTAVGGLRDRHAGHLPDRERPGPS